MSTAGALVRKLLQAHAKGDAAAFKAAAEAYIAEERRKNHHILANDLERALLNGSYDQRSPLGPGLRGLNLLGVTEHDLPRDAERGALLLEIIAPHRTLDTLVLNLEVREGLERIVIEQGRADVLRSYGLRPIGKALFCGPPGCGKTVAAEAVAQALDLPLVLVRFDAVVSSYLGETAANLRKVFTFAASRQMVMLFDEFDAIGKQRTASEEHGELKRVVNAFLQMLDGFRGESLLIAATNHQGLLDPALWRRFDEVIFFDRPDAEASAEILRRVLHQVGLAPGIVLIERARELIGASHADVERIGLDAVKQTVLNHRTQITAAALDEATRRYFMRRALTVPGVTSMMEDGRMES
ncbi:MAG: ATP-binding protein [Candidatus Viridilinea halotolerans]|uniref:ATP-binding protein n=1 Tax=Candidatus Viridilinea halotolerans TaxID=2491704 RepID=A0A426TSN6_9CHLR|nr:MAG: ATP-binding protein [Candidatus Viridilinea halotolerans]